MAKFRQNRHSRRIRRIRQNRRFVGTPISSPITLWRNIAKIAILAEFAGFAKIAASSIPLSRAQSLFGEISPKSPFSPDSPDSPKSPLRRYPYLELNRSLAKFRQNRRFVGTPISSSIALWRNIAKIAILAEFAGFAKIAASSVPLSRAQSLLGEISQKSPFSPNSPDSSKSPLRRYPYLELNRSLAKYRQNRHSRRIRRIRQNRRFVGTPISSSIAPWRNFAKIAILAEFAGFVIIAASSVPLSRAQSLFGEISPKSPFSPNSPDSPKSPLRRYPYLELNRSLAKYRQNRHSRRIRRIRQNRRFVGTPISSSIALWRNFAKIAILAELAGFAKIAASLVPLSRAQSLFGEISPKSPFSPDSPDSPKSPLRRYPYLELNRSLAKFRQNRHSRRIRRIHQNRRFVGTPISSSIALWRNIAKIAILAGFVGFAKIAASSVPLSRAQSLFGEISPKSPFSPDSPKSSLGRYPYLELNRSLPKFRQNRHSRRICRIRFELWRNFVKIAKFAIACISGHISVIGKMFTFTVLVNKSSLYLHMGFSF